jgi:hypothetical protein
VKSKPVMADTPLVARIQKNIEQLMIAAVFSAIDDYLPPI